MKISRLLYYSWDTSTSYKQPNWSISSTTLTRNGGGIRLNGNGNNSEISINSHTFGNEGIQLGFNGGAPRFYVGNGGDNFLRYDTSNGVKASVTDDKGTIAASLATDGTAATSFDNGTKKTTFTSSVNMNLEVKKED